MQKNQTAPIKHEMEFISRIQNIHVEDLPYIEKDLSFNEKAALGFLLFGNNKANNLFVLQKLLVLYKNQNQNSDLLFCFARHNAKSWRYILIEALTIIKARRVLRKLGINRNEYEKHFLPHRPETSLAIHPVLKGLYFLCEDLNLSETRDLILEVNEPQNLTFNDLTVLEIFLLEWMSNSVISIGEWPICSDSNNKPNLKLIYSYLKKNEKFELKDMLENVCKYVSNTNENNATVLLENNIQNLKIESKILPGPSGNIQNKFETDNSDMNDAYIIDKNKAGFVLIINQREFYEETDSALKYMLPKKKLGDRRGTDMDKISLKFTFEKIGYQVCDKENLTHNQILFEIRDFIKRSFYYDSFIICILSHGLEGVVYGSNSIPVQIKEIKDILASSHELLKKPKILIIQACQGTKMQKAGSLEIDSPVENLQIRTMASNNIKIEQQSNHLIIDKKHYGDILTIWSTVPGYASFRDTSKGTWFIQTFCKKIQQNSDKRHLLDIVTLVIGEVSNMKSNDDLLMIPQYESSLSKYLWLPKSC